jgi:hypothetical protein
MREYNFLRTASPQCVCSEGDKDVRVRTCLFLDVDAAPCLGLLCRCSIPVASEVSSATSVL